MLVNIVNRACKYIRVAQQCVPHLLGLNPKVPACLSTWWHGFGKSVTKPKIQPTASQVAHTHLYQRLKSLNLFFISLQMAKPSVKLIFLRAKGAKTDHIGHPYGRQRASLTQK